MASSADPDESRKHPDPENSSLAVNPPPPPPPLPEDASRSLEGHPQSPLPTPATAGQPNQLSQPYQQSHQPQAMGYPPVIGYPPGHPPPPYPPGYGPYPNYVSAPPPQGGYYPNPTYLPLQGPPGRQSGIMSSGFIRGVLMAIIILVFLSALSSVITYIVVRPKQPVFHLASFLVTNFNVSNAVLMASWEAKVTVENPNEKLRAYFNRIESYVYYEEPENYLAFNSESEGPVSVDVKTNTTITLRASMINNEQPDKSVLDKIENERKSGLVSFGLGIRLMGTFKSSSWTLLERIQVSCEDIKVTFGPESTTGTLATSDKPKECSVYAT